MTSSHLEHKESTRSSIIITSFTYDIASTNRPIKENIKTGLGIHTSFLQSSLLSTGWCCQGNQTKFKRHHLQTRLTQVLIIINIDIGLKEARLLDDLSVRQGYSIMIIRTHCRRFSFHPVRVSLLLRYHRPSSASYPAYHNRNSKSRKSLPLSGIQKLTDAECTSLLVFRFVTGEWENVQEDHATRWIIYMMSIAKNTHLEHGNRLGWHTQIETIDDIRWTTIGRRVTQRSWHSNKQQQTEEKYITHTPRNRCVYCDIQDTITRQSQQDSTYMTRQCWSTVVVVTLHQSKTLLSFFLYARWY